MPQSSQVPEATVGAIALRAAAPGLLVAAVGGAVVIASGGLPEGGEPFVAAGAAAAAITGAVGVRLKARVVVRPSGGQDPRESAQQLQIAVFGDFALQLLTIGAAMIGSYIAGVKFTSVASLALAFATVALVHQLGSALVLSRILRRRTATSQPAAPGSSSEVSPDHPPGLHGRQV